MSEERLKQISSRLERIDHKEYCCGFEFADSGSFDETARCFEERKELCNEVIRLQKRNKEIYDGFMATQEELSDYAEENDKLRAKIDKAIEWCECVVNAEKEGVNLPNGDFTDTGYCQVLAVPLLEILRGEDNE